MSEIDNGGSAFPHPTSPQIKGMTLRQWFADAMIAEGNKDGAE